MEKVLMKNYGLDIEAAINEALSKCQNRATDMYHTEQEKKKYKSQLIYLKALLGVTKTLTQQINDI
jgi:hypothetical protein